jgi:TolB-like protein/DNA-binding SARP family transcriptional activator
VTDTAASTKYRLETFGSLALTGPGDDTVLGTHGHHRRRLALLAVLAAAGEKGRSRDQILLLFWPDATQSRARHSLDQLLYTLRSSIGESVFAGANPVRLNSGVVASDVGAFTAALDRGDLERAVKEHRGLFLDGFYLEDAPEFERWVEAERARLSTSYSDALEGLAHRAEAAHDYSTAVGWWRKLAEFDPISSKHASGLIRALMNAGHHPAALQYAERYEAIVAQELGTGAGPAIASLVAEVRAQTDSEAVVPPKSRPPAVRVSPTATAISIAATPADASRPAVSHRRRGLPYAIGALVVAVILLGTALWRRTAAGGNRQSAATETSIAVLPLANVSRDPQDAAFVDGLTEELIAALAKIHNLRVIARTSAFAFKNTDAGLHAIADSLGVPNVLVGSVQKVGSRLRVQVRLVDARDGSTRWSETYDRALGDLFAVQSDIAGAVARALDLRLGGSALAHIKRGPTSSIAAHELYLRGNDPAMRSVLLRHFPELGPSLQGVANPFAPWKPAGS